MSYDWHNSVFYYYFGFIHEEPVVEEGTQRQTGIGAQLRAETVSPTRVLLDITLPLQVPKMEVSLGPGRGGGNAFSIMSAKNFSQVAT